MQIKIRGFIMSKKGELYADCRDNYALNKTLHRFAISDGVSRSFFPGIWSELLVTNFVNNSAEISSLVSTCQEEWMRQVKTIVEAPDVKYFTRNAFNRKTPGMATFVGLTLSEKDKVWNATALGDSYLFFIPDKVTHFKTDLIVLSSKDNPEIFDNYPDYFSSMGNHNGNMKDTSGQLQPGTFYMMTDALAEWFLKQGEYVSEIIKVWGDQIHFERFIETLRDHEKISNDDTSVLIIEISGDGQEHFSYEQVAVSDLKVLIAQQTEEQPINEVSIEEGTISSTETTIEKIPTVQPEPATPMRNFPISPGSEPN
jgi:hypothetical protein